MIQYLGLVLLVLTYTIGIATIILQLLCYRREIEYKETILFTSSFLLLVIVLIIDEFFQLTGRTLGRLFDIGENFVYILLAVTIPLNLHTERVVNFRQRRNQVTILLAIILVLIYAMSFFLGFEEVIGLVIQFFLYISVFYSMILIFRAKPSLLVLHREKIERKSALIIMIIIPLFSLLALLNKFLPFVDKALFGGPVIISIIGIYLCLSKIFDDFQRLSMFTPANTCTNDKLSLFKITQREEEVLNLLIKGSTYKQIAEQLFISVPTVKTHVSNIYQKMQINNKVELINLINN